MLAYFDLLMSSVEKSVLWCVHDICVLLQNVKDWNPESVAIPPPPHVHTPHTDDHSSPHMVLTSHR